MVTYIYWGIALVLALIALIQLGRHKVMLGVGVALGILLIAWAAYFFHFQQLFVKRLGGVMSITMPAHTRHLGATWKDDNLWIETYHPDKQECVFQEYSKGNLLQGRVVIKQCQPITLGQVKPQVKNKP